MKSHTDSLITSVSSLTEQLGIHDLTEQELEQAVGAQSWGHDHDHDWDDYHRRGWGYNHGWKYSRGWRR